MTDKIYFFLLIIFNLFLIFKFDSFKFFKINIDKPDDYRKFHKKPTPLAGGTIIALNLCLYFVLILSDASFLKEEIIYENYKILTVFFSISLFIFFVGFLDDKFNFKPVLKFILLSIVILIILFLDDSVTIKIVKFSFLDNQLNISKYSIFFTLFCFLVFLNAFNMIDGINLQASSYSLIVFFSIYFFYAEILIIKTLLISIIGYSYLNFKNKTFFGDSGSLLISFIMGYLFIKLYNKGLIISSDEVIIYMLIPGLDLIRLFFKRIITKKNPLKGDRFHLHHLLLKKFSYPTTLIIFLSLIISPIILNIYEINRIFIISFAIIVYSILIFFVRSNKSS